MARSQEEYIQEVTELYKEKYRYDKVVYTKWNSVIKVFCPVEDHGYFKVNAHNHRHGCGCPKCHPKHRRSQKEAETLLNKVLSKYDFCLAEPFVYSIGRNTKIKVKCPKHDYVWTEQYEHTVKERGSFGFLSCRKCKGELQRISIPEAISRSKNYKTRTEFAQGDKAAYRLALSYGIDECFEHMKVRGSMWKRCIYAYYFNIDGEKYVYVGLTFNLENRDKGHLLEGSAVYAFCKKHNISKPQPVQLTDYVDKKEAVKLEEYYLEKHIKEGWNKINIAKTGNLGGPFYRKEYPLDELKSIASKYRHRTEWDNSEDHDSCYYALSLGVLDDIIPRVRHTKYTFEECLEEGKKYPNDNQFEKHSNGFFQAAKRNNWLSAIRPFYCIVENPRVKLFFTKLLEYGSLKLLRANEYNLYVWAKNNKHIISNRETYETYLMQNYELIDAVIKRFAIKPNPKYEERFFRTVSKYSTWKEFAENEKTICVWALRNKYILEKCQLYQDKLKRE